MVGVPLTTPAELRVRPGGRDPLVTDHVGVGLPVAIRLWLYAVPTVAAGRMRVASAAGGCPARKLKVAVPAALSWPHPSTTAPAGTSILICPLPVSGPRVTT